MAYFLSDADLSASMDKLTEDIAAHLDSDDPAQDEAPLWQMLTAHRAIRLEYLTRGWIDRAWNTWCAENAEAHAEEGILPLDLRICQAPEKRPLPEVNRYNHGRYYNHTRGTYVYADTVAQYTMTYIDHETDALQEWDCFRPNATFLAQQARSYSRITILAVRRAGKPLFVRKNGKLARVSC